LSRAAHLLDASAILTFTDNEEGAGAVEELLKKAKKGETLVHISAMTAMELYYVSSGERGEDEADRLLLFVRALPVTELSLESALVMPAARFKARYKISVADAWIAATAAVHDLILVHKDPEFERISEEVSLMSLPYKSKKKKAPGKG
jgi:predicted nucleic acid-binding protein